MVLPTRSEPRESSDTGNVCVSRLVNSPCDMSFYSPFVVTVPAARSNRNTLPGKKQRYGGLERRVPRQQHQHTQRRMKIELVNKKPNRPAGARPAHATCSGNR